MNRLRYVAVLSFLALFVAACSLRPAAAQPAPVGGTTPGAYVSHSVDGPAVVVQGERAALRVSFYRPPVVRVDWLPEDATSPDTSFAVVQVPDPRLDPVVRDTDAALLVRTPELTVTIHKEPLRVAFDDGRRERLLAEMAPPFVVTDSSRTVQFEADSTEHVYGTGERGSDTHVDLQGRAFDPYNTQRYGYEEAHPTMKINVPMAVTTGGYGLFVDDVVRGRLDVGGTEPGRTAYTSEAGAVSYYVIAGDVREQLRHYTWLTGRQPLPPKWALGYIQSKYGYRNEAAARGVVDTLRSKGFPVDVLVLDLHWFEHMGDLRWNRDAWPTPFQMMRDLRERGVKTVAITETYVSEPSRLYHPAIDSGHVATRPGGSAYELEDWWSCPDGCKAVLADLTRPATREWWWAQHPPFMGEEMAGLWTDLGEPEKHPDAMQHHMGPAPQIHNAYNLLWAETLFHGWREIRPNQRIFNLTRSGSAGIQRFGTVHWSGDVRRSFTGLAQQSSLMLNAGLSGLAYYGSDIGGYLGDTRSPELYVRWMQHGALTPTMRPHGVDNVPTEPWRFGAEAERISREFVRLRYRLMPYLYTLAYQNHTEGLPIARPLFFADPSDETLHDYAGAHLLGDALLAAPVVRDSARTKAVRLPRGRWMDWWTGETVDGSRTVTANAPLDRIPLYQKAGTIVPMRPVRMHVEAQPADTLLLSIVPELPSAATPSPEPAAFTLYEDDGATLNYQRGAYALTRITQHATADALTLTVGAASGDYDGLPAERTVRATVHRMDAAPQEVRAGERALSERTTQAELQRDGGYRYDADRNALILQVRLPTHTAHSLHVRTAP